MRFEHLVPQAMGLRMMILIIGQGVSPLFLQR